MTDLQERKEQRANELCNLLRAYGIECDEIMFNKIMRRSEAGVNNLLLVAEELTFPCSISRPEPVLRAFAKSL